MNVEQEFQKVKDSINENIEIKAQEAMKEIDEMTREARRKLGIKQV